MGVVCCVLCVGVDSDGINGRNRIEAEEGVMWPTYHATHTHPPFRLKTTISSAATNARTLLGDALCPNGRIGVEQQGAQWL